MMNAHRTSCLRRWPWLLLVLLTCHVSLVTCYAADAEELRVGYVNLGKLIESYQRTKVLEGALEKKGKQKESELQTRVEDLKKMRQGLELLSDEAREAKSRQIEEKAEELQRFRTSTGRDLRRERDKAMEQVLKDVEAEIQAYGKANGYSLILDERSLVYAQSAHDVTDAVLKQLNSRPSASP